MLHKFINWFGGWVKLEIGPEIERAIDLLMFYNINYWNLKKVGDKIFISLTHSDHKYVCELMDKFCIPWRIAEKHGLNYIIGRYKKRPGFYVGALIFFLSLWGSTQFIWDMTITGNKSISDAEIAEKLNEYGCFIGAYTPKIDFFELCNVFVHDSDTISWISINMHGTTAEVEVKEYVPKQFGETDDDGISALTASRDGQIVRYEVYSGVIAVNVNETVTKGQLLVNGVVQLPRTIRFVNARGKVFAKTQHEISVTCPFEGSEKVQTNTVLQNKSLSVLGKNIKLFTGGSILPTTYDTIENKYRIVIFGSIELPVWVNEEYADGYELTPRTLTEEEAKERAEAMLSERISKELPDADILTITRSESLTDSGYTIKCQIYCVEDIAVKVPINTNLTAETKK